jgi:biotin operon repressor
MKLNLSTPRKGKNNMKSFIDRIEEFESGELQTVSKFNSLFVDAPLVWNNQNAEVEVLGIVGPANVREILVDGCRKRHEFPLPLDESRYHDEEAYDPSLIDENDTKKYLKNYPTNEGKENFVLTNDEMKLDPFEYFIMQYLRGCDSPYHTTTEIAKKLNMSTKTVHRHTKNMQEKGMIVITSEIRFQRIHIKVTDAWQ